MDKKRIFQELEEDYQQTHKKSKEIFIKACGLQIRGGSHNIRLFNPYPFYDVTAGGSKVTDIDGNTYIDFWQGHFANILGHNPPIVTRALKESFDKGQGLITGFPGAFQHELAELILSRIAADKIRFTTSGALATMYAVMLSKSFTQRTLVMKIGGGWHGAQPFGLKGISAYDQGLDQVESAGLPAGVDSEVITTRFNDLQDLETKFKLNGEQIACLIMELVVGAGGVIFATPEYVRQARKLTEQYGALLIVDEVISGFRFHAGGLQTLYGITPDLSVFGKSIGGGMPVSAVAGKDEVMALPSPEAPPKQMVKFDGGTFSAHPASMLAGLVFIKYLIAHENEIYPKIGRLGSRVRKEIERIFNDQGICVRSTGDGNPVTENSSMVAVHFLIEEQGQITCPEQAWNPDISDVELREKIFKLAMINEGFFTFHGYGAISDAHTEEEIQSSLDAVERIAKKWSK